MDYQSLEEVWAREVAELGGPKEFRVTTDMVEPGRREAGMGELLKLRTIDFLLNTHDVLALQETKLASQDSLEGAVQWCRQRGWKLAANLS